MTRLFALALVALALTAQNAAAAKHVDVIVDSAKLSLSSVSGGISTATAVASNTGTTPIPITASVPQQPACGVDVSPKTVAPAQRTNLTLIFDPGCDVTKSTSVTLRFGPRVVPATATLAVTPAPAGADWNILPWSFLISLGAALAVTSLIAWLILRYDKLPPPSIEDATIAGPKAKAADAGPITAGTYAYELTHVRRRWPLLPFNRESGTSEPSSDLVLASSSYVEVTLPKVDDERVIQRRVYRRKDPHTEFRRVREVPGRDKATFVDGWTPIRLDSPLASLGTNWSFKDNWIGSVTVGSTVLVALFASNDTLGAVVGPSAKPSLTAMAVAAAVAAVFVGLGPLIVKLCGPDLNVPTAGGTLLAALVTLVGSVGQIVAITWLTWDLEPGNDRLRAGIVAIGGTVGVVVLWYAAQALWYYLRTGAASAPSKKPDALAAAELIVAAINSQSRVMGAAAEAARLKTAAESAPPEKQGELIEAARRADLNTEQLVTAQNQQFKVFFAAAGANMQPETKQTALL